MIAFDLFATSEDRIELPNTSKSLSKFFLAFWLNSLKLEIYWFIKISLITVFLRPFPGDFIVCAVSFIVNNCKEKPFSCRVCNPVFCRKLIPGHGACFVNRIDNPFGVILSGFYTAVIYPKISSKFQGCLDYITSISNILENAVPYPEVWLQLLCFF